MPDIMGKMNKQALVLEIKNDLTEKLLKIKKLIDSYLKLTGSVRPAILDLLKYHIDDVTMLFGKLGYTYEPDIPPLDDEESLIKQFSEYQIQIDRFIDNYEEKNFEAFNVDTRRIAGLIELSRTEMMKEGEVLSDVD